jgi:hypothetical protein
MMDQGSYDQMIDMLKQLHTCKQQQIQLYWQLACCAQGTHRTIFEQLAAAAARKAARLEARLWRFGCFATPLQPSWGRRLCYRALTRLSRRGAFLWLSQLEQQERRLQFGLLELSHHQGRRRFRHFLLARD